MSEGVVATFATNNVQNLFTFTGDGDVLKVATLLCQLLHCTSAAQTEQCVAMATSVAAKALGALSHGIAVGNPADFFIIEGRSAMELIAAPSAERTVLKLGRVVSMTSLSRKLFISDH